MCQEESGCAVALQQRVVAMLKRLLHSSNEYRKHGNSCFQVIRSAFQSFWTEELSKEEESKKKIKNQQTTTKFHLHS